MGAGLEERLEDARPRGLERDLVGGGRHEETRRRVDAAAAQDLGRHREVFEARVCLTFDPENKVNGLKWSSSTGPPKQIGSGALCQSSVVVDLKKPYTYVIPSIKRTLGV